MGMPDGTAGQLNGVYAAMPTPFGKEGRPDLGALDPVVDFLIDAGVTGLCVGGATGEYPACSIRERELIFQRVAARTKGRVPLIFGVGAGNSAQVGYLGKVALECGGSAVLLPPPFYFRYDAKDLVEFIGDLGRGLPLPVLIYYIPQFTNRFDLADALRLIEEVPNIIGIKDSSGIPENVQAIGKAKTSLSMTYFSGDDSLLINALHHGADGAISGVASACPELLAVIEEARRNGKDNYPDWAQKLLTEFIARIDAFPAPWGVKLAMEARGFQLGPLSWTGSRKLEGCAAEFRKWLDVWLPTCLEACSSHNASAKRGGE